MPQIETFLSPEAARIICKYCGLDGRNQFVLPFLSPATPLLIPLPLSFLYSSPLYPSFPFPFPLTLHFPSLLSLLTFPFPIPARIESGKALCK